MERKNSECLKRRGYITEEGEIYKRGCLGYSGELVYVTVALRKARLEKCAPLSYILGKLLS